MSFQLFLKVTFQWSVDLDLDTIGFNIIWINQFESFGFNILLIVQIIPSWKPKLTNILSFVNCFKYFCSTDYQSNDHGLQVVHFKRRIGNGLVSTSGRRDSSVERLYSTERNVSERIPSNEAEVGGDAEREKVRFPRYAHLREIRQILSEVVEDHRDVRHAGNIFDPPWF